MTSQGAASSASLAIHAANTLVVKIGSSLWVDVERGHFRHQWFDSFITDLMALRSNGVRVIVVSSGAIALGCLSTGSSRVVQTLA